ncbi:MAG TPA: type III pantothenate kinase [Chthoniobacteraceae bacterium]|nr:type III pantothenate kinase [Chthoniobacteraceae bacterium]
MSAAPEYLLIDISNSFTKVSPANAAALVGETARLATRSLSATTLTQAAGPPQSYRAVVLSSVVPAAVAAVEAYLATAPAGAAAPRLLCVGPALRLGIGIDYPDPASIGADRLANAAGAALFYGAPAIVVDFGTALTFDVIAEAEHGPTYTGGVIAPGLEAMTHYLHQRTALLPKIDLHEPVAAIGKSTRDAMLAGAVYGYRGLVREILHAITRELCPAAARPPTVVATGGYAELIAREMPEIARVDPRLTLEGLRVIATLN